MKRYAAAILALATSAGCKSEVGGVPCIADSICQPLCASDPDCARASPSMSLLCDRYVVEDEGNGNDLSGSGIVRDTRTNLRWLRYIVATDNQANAESYCRGRGMRLPNKAEAVAIAEDSYCKPAWPKGWWTWTSTPASAGNTWVVAGHGYVSSSKAVPNDYGGWTLCVR